MAAGSVTPNEICHRVHCVDRKSRKGRKEGLPKREPAWSTGGKDSRIESMAARIESTWPKTGAAVS